MLTPLLFIFEIWQKRVLPKGQCHAFRSTVNKFKFGQVIEVLKITIFLLQFPEPRVILATSYNPHRFDASAFMLHLQHLHEWLCLVLVQTKGLCQSAKGTRRNRHGITMASVGTWCGGGYIRKEGRKGKSLGWEIQSVGAADKEKRLKWKEKGGLWAKMWWRHHFRGKLTQRNRAPSNVQCRQGMTFFWRTE